MSQHRVFSISLLAIITVATLLVHQSTASCGVCGSNGIACISGTQFYICFNNQPDRSTTYECPNQGTCTALRSKCSDAANAPADCTTTVANSCGCAVGGGMFACTSRTTFAQCDGATVVVANSTCPNGLVCSTSRGGEICVDECLLEGQIECDIAAPGS